MMNVCGHGRSKCEVCQLIEAEAENAQLRERVATLELVQHSVWVALDEALTKARREERARCVKVVQDILDSYSNDNAEALDFIEMVRYPLRSAVRGIRSLGDER